jgi:glycosyltransferase involved in cell wall biosynthesis
MLEPPPHSTPELSVVTLCYKAGETTRDLAAGIAASLKAAGITNYEIVLVGNYVDGTDDPTPRIVRELADADDRIQCSAVAKRGMMGWDMRSGLELARGASLAIFDGDGQIVVEDLARGFHELRRRELDLIIARRVRRGDGFVRKTMSTVFNALFRLLFPGLKSSDVNAKPKILTRAAFERLELTSDDWFIDAEILIQARRFGLRVGEFDTEFLGLTGRYSFVNLRAVLEFVGNLARHRVREFGRRREE